jgi:hypothetical protein
MTTILPKTLLVLGTGLFLLPGCPLLDIQADVPEVCLKYPNLEVTNPAPQSSVTQSFVFDDLSAVHDIAKQNADVQFVRAEVRATSGVENLAFVQAVKVTVSSPGSNLPAMTMYDCNGDCVPDGATLEIPASQGDNAIEYLRQDSIAIDLDFKGQIPAGTFTMDVDVCLKGNASYSVSP